MTPRNSKPTLAVAMLVASPMLMVVATIGMIQRIEPFSTWYYCFAWWAYILFIEAWLFTHGGQSLLLKQPGNFLRLLPLSIGIWLIFELYNFRLQNWHYLNLPASTPVRWLGYSLSFATVLPGLFGSRQLALQMRWFSSAACPPIRWQKRQLVAISFIGGLLTLAPVVWPRIAFPSVWLGFIFLLEPLNYWLGAPSLLQDLERGTLSRLYQFLVAGMWCGFLWEFWNYWAGSKWVYTLPFLNRPRLFEMPVAGFLGFAPFAVECFVLVSTLDALQHCASKGLNPSNRRRLMTAVWVLGVLFCLTIFLGIDHFSVRSYHG